MAPTTGSGGSSDSSSLPCGWPSWVPEAMSNPSGPQTGPSLQPCPDAAPDPRAPHGCQGSHFSSGPFRAPRMLLFRSHGSLPLPPSISPYPSPSLSNHPLPLQSPGGERSVLEVQSSQGPRRSGTEADTPWAQGARSPTETPTCVGLGQVYGGVPASRGPGGLSDGKGLCWVALGGAWKSQHSIQKSSEAGKSRCIVGPNEERGGGGEQPAGRPRTS